MTILKTRKSLDGILDALFYSFTKGIISDNVIALNVYQMDFTSVIINVPKFSEKDRLRVKSALVKYSGEDIINDVNLCLLSGDEKALKYAFDYTRATLNRKTNCICDISNPFVAPFRYCIKNVLDERHRATGFIRFRESENGVLYAPFSPDNDIVGLVAPHFLRRLGTTPFILHDVKRNKVAISDGNTFHTFTTEKIANFTPSENERFCVSLWQKYYNSVNIESRKNTRQQNNFMPKRYRKFMPETWETDV